MMSDAVLELLESGYREQKSGKLDAAERRYRSVLEQDPGNIHALNLLGIVCINTGRAEEAVQLISKALEQDAGDAEAQANLGLAFKDLRQFEKARDAFQRAVRINPRNPVTWNNLGNVQAALGEHMKAIDAYRSALKLDANYVECLSNLAIALKENRSLTGALAAADRAIKLKPDFAEAHNNRGEILFKMARFEAAVESYRQAIRHGDNYVAARINLSAALKEAGDVAGARTLLEDETRRDPDNPRAWNNLGVLLEQLGEGEDAAAAFRRAVALSPDYANAWYQLAQLRGQGLTDDEVATVSGMLDRSELPDDQRMPLSFALACAFENRAEFDSAFGHLSAAQALKARRYPYDDEQVGRYYTAIRDTFPIHETVELAPTGTEKPVPVFVLGLPRSGTSLTEQILDSHPAVCGAGELSFMEDTVVMAREMTGKPFPDCVPSLDANQKYELGASYLQRLRARSNGEDYVVDKTPMNFQYIGFMLAILPGARIIHCTRHPVDNCLSIFKLPFEETHSYGHSLESLGRYYHRYRALMQHWQRLYPDRIRDLRYEDMVADQEKLTRELLDFIGLPFDDAVLRFHETKRIVKTPSASQVRQPIYKSSVARWKNYEPHLGPLIESLGDLADV